MAKFVNRMRDLIDHGLCLTGLRKCASWDEAISSDPVQLYAGKLRRGLPQFATHIGITPFFPSSRNIAHDLVNLPYPIPNESVDAFQAEDVFEHVPLELQIPIYDEIYRILKPGGFFRISLPDYNFDGYRDRSIRDEAGKVVFDPGGGGLLEDGVVTNGGHLWFPTIEIMRGLFASSLFGGEGEVTFVQYNEDDGTTVMNSIDYSLGHIQRTPDHDLRVVENPRPVSIVIDAWKPGCRSEQF